MEIVNLECQYGIDISNDRAGPMSRSRSLPVAETPIHSSKQGFPTRFLRAPSSIPSRLFQRPLSESCILDSYLGLGRGALSSWFAQKIRHDGESIGDDEGSFPGRWSGKRVLHKISTFSDNGHLFDDNTKLSPGDHDSATSGGGPFLFSLSFIKLTGIEVFWCSRLIWIYV